MDLKIFFQKLKQTEASIAEAHVVVVSLETPDGGRAGVRTEVSRGLAARLIVEGKARLATAEESAECREQAAEAKRAADQAATANRIQIAVVSDSELKALKTASRPARS
jgi:predicted Zn-dependent protease